MSWGFTAPNEFEENLRKHNEPMESHDCERFGCTGRYPRKLGHEYQEVYDDFALSQRQREELDMEIIRARNNDLKQRLIIRRFISTVDGSYIIRLQTTDSAKLQRERMGDIRFETEDECNEYYNYCIDLFEFSKSLRISSDGWDFEDEDEDESDSDAWAFDDDENGWGF